MTREPWETCVYTAITHIIEKPKASEVCKHHYTPEGGGVYSKRVLRSLEKEGSVTYQEQTISLNHLTDLAKEAKPGHQAVLIRYNGDGIGHIQAINQQTLENRPRDLDDMVNLARKNGEDAWLVTATHPVERRQSTQPEPTRQKESMGRFRSLYYQSRTEPRRDPDIDRRSLNTHLPRSPFDV